MHGEIDRIVIKTIDEDIVIDSVGEIIRSIRHSRFKKGYMIRCDSHDIFVADSVIKSIVVTYYEDY